MFEPTAYLDEAGISITEPAIVTAGVLVMNEWQEAALREQLSRLRDEYETRSAFHLADIWHGRGDFKKGGWPVDKRLALAQALVSLPMRLHIAVVMGFHRRDMKRHEGKTRRSALIVDHTVAFAMCAMGIDECMKEYAPGQTPRLVVEDNEQARRSLSRMHASMRGETIISRHHGAIRGYERALEIGPIEFRRKDDPFLQVADACCFTISRVLSGRKDADLLFGPMTMGGISISAFDDRPYGHAVLFPYFRSP